MEAVLCKRRTGTQGQERTECLLLYPAKSYARIPVNINLPNLIEVQLDSFERLKSEGLGDLFHEVSPIESYNKGMKFYFPSRGPEFETVGT